MKHHCQRVHIFLTLASLLCSLAFSLSSIQPVSAQSGTWYVSTRGLDSNACNTPQSPCRTINAAIAKAAPGDTIMVAVGKFTGAAGKEQVVRINKSITLSGGWNEGFTARSGRSTIDGSGVRRGIEIISDGSPAATIAVMDRFTIQNGFAVYSSGGGIYNGGTLTLSNSVVRRNVSEMTGGGIYNNEGSTLTISNTTISENSAGKLNRLEGHGGGIDNDGGTVNIDNSTVSGNQTVGRYGNVGYGNGIYTNHTVILNNSTVSGNAFNTEGIKIVGGMLLLNNSTVTDHLIGITLKRGKLSLRNSIVAGNGVGGDCNSDPTYGTIISQGYNLIGNGKGCSFNKTTGDLVGTKTNPIDPRLGPLQNNGGPTFTHALLRNSPAINAGNPAEPGSGGTACLPTDQRGVDRLEGSTCDIGAYEVDIPLVSVRRLGPEFTAASSVIYTVTFSEPVTGVDLVEPFSDFALTASGAEGPSITAVSGSGSEYIVTVNTGIWSESATIRLDVIDDDSIQDASGNSIGGPGAGNGNFTGGPAYTLTGIPRPLSPTGLIVDKTPTFAWARIDAVDTYELTVLRGAQTIYTVTVPASTCGASQCTNTPATKLANNGKYTWKVRAWVGSQWHNYSPAMTFQIFIPKPGYWRGRGMEFFVTTDGLYVDNFAVYVNVYGCGAYKITRNPLVAITKQKFWFPGTFYADGTFTTTARASGALGLRKYYIRGCGIVSGGPFSWIAVWQNSKQPAMAAEAVDELSITLIPELGITPELQTLFDAFTVEPLK